MTRSQIIFSLMNCGDVEEMRIGDRLRNCNVRIVRSDGSTERSNDRPRTAREAGAMMQNDPTIERFEYDFNNKWTTAV